MIEKCEKSLNQGEACGALLAELPKAFDCLHHGLLIVKLHAYGLDMASLKLIHFYLTKRKQRVKINEVYSFLPERLSTIP